MTNNTAFKCNYISGFCGYVLYNTAKVSSAIFMLLAKSHNQKNGS